MTSSRPRPPVDAVVGILARPGSPSGFVALVRALGPWCRPRAVDRRDIPVVAWLASSPGCAEGAGDAPMAVWVDDLTEFEVAGALDQAGPRVLVTADAEVAVLASGSVLFPDGGLDLRASLPMAPVIRQRWRSRLELPTPLVVTSGGHFPIDLLPTGFALASVVIATGPRLAEALAWGAPCVTDAPSAAALGAADGVEVLVGVPSDFAGLADRIAADDELAATLSQAGRRLVERRADRHRAAGRVASALGLAGGGGHMAGATTARVLDALRTPATSPVRVRIDTLVGS